MARWKPNARQRLQAAALALFSEEGYDGTTVADIADRAGLEKRSFFRYFPDKREVLFSGSSELTEFLRRSVETQAATVSPWEAIVNALEESEDIVATDRDLARVRRDVISRNAELREREVLKSAQLEDLLCALLVQRGVGSPRARVTARLASLVYELAFDAWLDAEPQEPFAACVAHTQNSLIAALPSR